MSTTQEPASTQATGWIDASVSLHDGMVHWPSDPAVSIRHAKDVEQGDSSTVSHLSLGAHSGTHVDAPAHFLPGEPGIDRLPLESLMGEARVIEIVDPVSIRVEELGAHDVREGERILFRTRNSPRCWQTDAFVPDYVYLSLEAARYLGERRVRTVGIDYLSIGGGGEGAAIHRALLEAGICVIEGLDLTQAKAGRYELICLPLKIRGGDGAPARVLLKAP